MPSRWADKLPRLKAAPASAPKHVTLVIPYYENPEFLLEQAAVWRSYPRALWPFLSVVIVDDGSPVPAVRPDVPFSTRLFRITVDVPWNWLAARNLGADAARAGWLLLTDIDHVVPPKTAAALVMGAHNARYIYAFERREHDGQAIAPHSASFLLTRDLFWRIGGYDEALAGHYGTDGEFRRRAGLLASFVVLTDVLIRHERRGDSSTTRYPRKLPTDATAVAAILAARRPGWRPKILSFPYEEVRS